MLIVGDFQTEWATLRDEVDVRARAHRLIAFYKAFDLTLSQHRVAVDVIRTWIHSPSQELREAVLYALCIFRPVVDCWDLIEVAWRESDAPGLSTCASAIEAYFEARARVPAQLLCTSIESLLAPRRWSEAPVDDQELTREYETSAAERALRHCVSVMEVEPEDFEARIVASAEVEHLRLVTQVLYSRLRRER